MQPIAGLDIMRGLRNIKSNKLEDMCNGPGKVSQSLGIDKEKMNGIDLTEGGFKIVDVGITDF